MDDKNVTRLERLAYIFLQLSSGARLSTKELAIQFNTTVRKTQLDFNEYILPYFDNEIIYYDFGAKRYISKENFLDKTFLNAKELAVLSIVKAKTKDKYCDESLYAETVQLFDKLEDSLKHNIYTNSVMECFEEKKDAIIQIKNAINSKNEIECIYLDKKRVLQPLKILNLEQYWYLINYDLEYEEIRKYHLNTINEVKILENKFNIDEEMVESFDNAINAFYKPNRTPFAVELHIRDKDIARYFFRKPLNNTQRLIKEYDDGSIDLEVYVTSNWEILPIIQRYMPKIVVISPDELTNIIKDNLEEYVEYIT